MDDEKLTLEDELLLLAYLDGELPPDQQAAFTARLEREPMLTAVLAQWRTLSDELNALPEPHLTRDLTAGVLTRLDAPASLPTRTWRSLLVVQVATAALVALLTWPLLASRLTLHPTLPAWISSLHPAWTELGQTWQTWWTANVWTPELWQTWWTAVWQGLDQAWLSLSWLLPLALVAAVIWLVSVRVVWHSAPVIGYKKG